MCDEVTKFFEFNVLKFVKILGTKLQTRNPNREFGLTVYSDFFLLTTESQALGKIVEFLTIETGKVLCLFMTIINYSFFSF